MSSLSFLAHRTQAGQTMTDSETTKLAYRLAFYMFGLAMGPIVLKYALEVFTGQPMPDLNSGHWLAFFVLRFVL